MLSLGAAQPDLVRIGKRRRVRLGELRRGDHRLLEHRAQHDLPPRSGAFGIGDRVVAARVGRDSGEQRRLGDRQVFRAVVEVDERCLLDAVGAVAEVDRVQVLLQDPLLGPGARALELPGERGLAHLAADRLLVAIERVLDELLRDRGAALDDLLLPDVRDQSARPMPRRSMPSCSQKRRSSIATIACRIGSAMSSYLTRVRACEPRSTARISLAARVVDVAVDLAVELLLRVELAGVDLARDCADQAEAERHRPEETEDGEERKEAKLADPAARTPRSVLPERPQGPSLALMAAQSGRDHGEHVLAVALELRRAEAFDRGEVELRCGLGGRELAQRGVVQDDVGGYLVDARSLEPPRAQALEQAFIGRVRRPRRRRRSSAAARRAPPAAAGSRRRSRTPRARRRPRAAGSSA